MNVLCIYFISCMILVVNKYISFRKTFSHNLKYNWIILTFLPLWDDKPLCYNQLFIYYTFIKSLINLKRDYLNWTSIWWFLVVLYYTFLYTLLILANFLTILLFTSLLKSQYFHLRISKNHNFYITIYQRYIPNCMVLCKCRSNKKCSISEVRDTWSRYSINI